MPDRATAAVAHGFSDPERKTADGKRPFGLIARPTLLSAATGSAKIVTPRREELKINR
jgi:hypothetical protein